MRPVAVAGARKATRVMDSGLVVAARISQISQRVETMAEKPNDARGGRSGARRTKPGSERPSDRAKSRPNLNFGADSQLVIIIH